MHARNQIQNFFPRGGGGSDGYLCLPRGCGGSSPILSLLCEFNKIDYYYGGLELREMGGGGVRSVPLFLLNVHEIFTFYAKKLLKIKFVM